MNKNAPTSDDINKFVLRLRPLQNKVEDMDREALALIERAENFKTAAKAAKKQIAEAKENFRNGFHEDAHLSLTLAAGITARFK